MILDEFTKSSGGEHGDKKKDGKKEEKPKTLSDLTPGKKATVEAIEEKISKLGFKAKIQALYVARKEAYSPTRCINGLVGAMNQFHIMSRNAIVPSLVTAAPYDKSGAKTAHMKSEFVERYKKRKMKGSHGHGGGHGHGGHASGPSHHPANPYVLNIEELATLYHFPIMTVKAPQMPKLEMKKSEPPSYLPLASSNFDEGGTSSLRDELDQLNMSNAHYEQRYGANRNQRPTTQNEAEEETAPDSVPHNLPLG
jgi:hypothetical protein